MISKRKILNSTLAALLAFGLAACDEGSGILDPQSGPAGTELDLAVDDDFTDALLADAEAALSAVEDVASIGTSGPSLAAEPNPDLVDEARALLEQARQKFVEARRAWRHGDTELAAQLAMEGRLLIAEALVLVFGEEAYADLLQRVNNVIVWLEEGVDAEVSELLDRIRGLRDEAEAIRAEDPTSEDNLIRATERLILALQIAHRERTQQRQQEMAQHARHSIFMASVGINLADNIIGVDRSDRQAYLLRHAIHLRNEAFRLYEAGRFRVAFALARESVNLSLVAVLLEPTTDVSKVAWMEEVSNNAIAAAEQAIVGLPSDHFLVRVLERAKELQARALAVADERPRLAIEVLWHSSLVAWAVVLTVSPDAAVP
ncbi:MAG: hypothetical protein GWN99_14960 [Gemmatimonadetes bacterium]|uniref:Uncharacterized protein n=1 Tax=Candidatus Kutchimonas denitrificans TaxID=3056748 RepID=A0AAE4ZAH6_9BACT|nr:hypothetical protein [Gemmatimonadota bacterium]NIR76324.1 hypothetical protein [Candidatus Kutchimonas denitrificans]NIS02347.1 hypothetical protein [Gemmatimonadota bacterium]NIT68166.1 hypothetical protein [Gemmatimonadota bacterium]NIU54390.1 hypothetical protein [Gemmatimonadota bacterium]